MNFQKLRARLYLILVWQRQNTEVRQAGASPVHFGLEVQQQRFKEHLTLVPPIHLPGNIKKKFLMGKKRMSFDKIMPNSMM